MNCHEESWVPNAVTLGNEILRLVMKTQPWIILVLLTWAIVSLIPLHNGIGIRTQCYSAYRWFGEWLNEQIWAIVLWLSPIMNRSCLTHPEMLELRICGLLMIRNNHTITVHLFSFCHAPNHGSTSYLLAFYLKYAFSYWSTWLHCLHDPNDFISLL